MSMPRLALREDLAVGHIQRGEQGRRGAVGLSAGGDCPLAGDPDLIKSWKAATGAVPAVRLGAGNKRPDQ